jgi:aspartyl-tRNA(Asn)/glutamyl-tRNA(Gln) amidotransferase subunit A
MDVSSMTAEAIRNGIITRQFTAKDVVDSIFRRIEEIEPLINGYLTLCREEALVQAELVDEKVRLGEPIGSLGGVPIAIKDNICTEGIKTTCASKMLQDFIPPYDATVVRRLKEADGVIIGKTNMDEFAMGSSTESSAFKITRNPWDSELVPGGSSGGSAAVVAAGMAAMSLGSDTGGSIRQPAAFCGVVGIKPTYGLVSRYGLVAFGSSLEQIGPIANSVKDSALLLQTIQGEDQFDGTTVRCSANKKYLSSIESGIKGMRIAVPVETLESIRNEEIYAALGNSMEVLKELGAEVEIISLPIATEGLSAYYIISSAEASSNLARYDGIRYGYRTSQFDNGDQLVELSRSEGFGDEVKRRIMLGTCILSSGYQAAYYDKAQRLRRTINGQFDRAFKRYDLLLSPTTPILPFRINEKCGDPMERYMDDIFTVSINLAGVPALSMPCGLSKSGLPIGLQLIGSHFEEEKIFRAAYAMENKLKLSMRPSL